MPLKLSAKMVNIILSNQIEQAPVKASRIYSLIFRVDVLQRGPHGVQADITCARRLIHQPQFSKWSGTLPILKPDTIAWISLLIYRYRAYRDSPGPHLLFWRECTGGINIITKRILKPMRLQRGMHALFNAEVRGALKAKSPVTLSRPDISV